MRGAERITTYIAPELGRELDALCLRRHLAKSRVIAEAIAEYVAFRRDRADVPLAARLPRHEGRPSITEVEDARWRETQLRKSSGRPLRAKAASDGDVNSSVAVRTKEAPDAA